LRNTTHITTDPAGQGPHGDENEFLTSAGVEAPAGTWQIVIPELSYVTGDQESETEISLRGPWTLEVIAP
jgi:hypothetical protein